MLGFQAALLPLALQNPRVPWLADEQLCTLSYSSLYSANVSVTDLNVFLFREMPPSKPSPVEVMV